MTGLGNRVGTEHQTDQSTDTDLVATRSVTTDRGTDHTDGRTDGLTEKNSPWETASRDASPAGGQPDFSVPAPERPAPATDWALVIRVLGHEPVGQGNMSIRYTKTGKPYLAYDDSTALKRWRRKIGEAADSARGALGGSWLPIGAAALVDVTLFVSRGSTVRRPYPSVRPDLDKLERAVLDALTEAAVVTDDAVICELRGRKRYADDRLPGATIRVRPLDGVLL